MGMTCGVYEETAKDGDGGMEGEKTSKGENVMSPPPNTVTAISAIGIREKLFSTA